MASFSRGVPTIRTPDDRIADWTSWYESLAGFHLFGLVRLLTSSVLGQLKLRSASVLLVGAGGLGCPAALYLAGAGVGTLGMVDGDTVESSNLHRQVLHRTKNVGKYKVDSAIEYLEEYDHILWHRWNVLLIHYFHVTD